jgi:hypothetical protein
VREGADSLAIARFEVSLVSFQKPHIDRNEETPPVSIGRLLRAVSQGAPARRQRVKSVMHSRFYLTLVWAASLSAQSPLHLQVDASDAPRRLLHVQMSLPAKPGPMTLLYPQWIPG